MQTINIGILSQGSQAKSILFVIGNPSSPNGNDANQKLHMEARGYTVTYIDDDLALGTETGYDCILISSSVSAGSVGAKFKNSSIPVVVAEHSVWDEMEFISGSFSTDTNMTDWNLVDDTHPIAGSLTNGVLTVWTATNNLRYSSSPASGADVVFESPDAAGRACLFVFEQGATLDDTTTAPARRVAISLAAAAWADRNTTCEAIFDRAIDWAMNII